MRTYVLVYNARQLVMRRGMQADRRTKIKKINDCANLDEAKESAERFLKSLPKEARAKFISLCSEHKWKPKL